MLAWPVDEVVENSQHNNDHKYNTQADEDQWCRKGKASVVLFYASIQFFVIFVGLSGHLERGADQRSLHQLMSFLFGTFRLRLSLDGRIETRLAIVDVLLRFTALLMIGHSTEHLLIILIFQVEIAEHLVGFLHLQKLFLVRFFALLGAVHIGIRMMLFALLKVGLLDLFVRRVYVYAKHIVVRFSQ